MEKTELLQMLSEDEFRLLELPVKATPRGPDDLLKAGYHEIANFVRANGRNPEVNPHDIAESKLAMRLKAFSQDDKKRELLAEVDDLGLLTEPEAPGSIEEVIADDPFGLLGGGEDILTLRHVPKTQTMPEQVARREPAPDFENFRQRFIDCHADVRAGRRKLIPFKNPLDIRPGRFFVQAGVLLYVDEVGDLEYNEIKKANTRTRCIFENGTESRLLLQSLASNLYKGGKRVTDQDDQVLDEVADRLTIATDTELATIYVLRSLSDDPQVKALPDLHKIGSTSTTVATRVQGAVSKTTFLGAAVESIAEYQVPRGVEGRVERMLHRLFAPVRVDAWFERDGKTLAEAREWFDVPLAVIDEAINLISNETIVNYEYDPEIRSLRLRR